MLWSFHYQFIIVIISKFLLFICRFFIIQTIENITLASQPIYCISFEHIFSPTLQFLQLLIDINYRNNYQFRSQLTDFDTIIPLMFLRFL